jgi:hypothetical protein
MTPDLPQSVAACNPAGRGDSDAVSACFSQPGASPRQIRPRPVPERHTAGLRDAPTSNRRAVFLRSLLRALGAWAV